MAIAFTLVFGAAFLFSALTYTIFWYEVLNLPRAEFDPEAHGGRKRLALIGFASSVASQLTIYFTYVFGLMRGLSEPAPYAAKTKPPVIFVHGLYHNPAAWIFYRWWLGKRGYQQLYCYRYSSFGPGFEDIAAGLAGRIREVSLEQGNKKVVLIGHSLGGLLIQAALGDPGVAALAAAVVTLGTPYRCSKLAVLGIGALSAGLVPGSPLCPRLPHFPDPAKTPWLCLASPADNMVLPPLALRPRAQGPEFRLTAPLCHVGMLYHKPTAEMAAGFLDRVLAAQASAAS
jgi:triacylglycerol lipase